MLRLPFAVHPLPNVKAAYADYLHAVAACCPWGDNCDFGWIYINWLSRPDCIVGA